MKMNFSLIVFALIAFTYACNENVAEKGSTIVDHEKHEQHDAPQNGLALNNGEKWKADSATNFNAENMAVIAADELNPAATVETYHIVGDALQNSINEMIKACKMRGPEHDALHLWLEPLMKDVKALNATTDLRSAEAAYEKVKTQIALYKQYFS